MTFKITYANIEHSLCMLAECRVIACALVTIMSLTYVDIVWIRPDCWSFGKTLIV